MSMQRYTTALIVPLVALIPALSMSPAAALADQKPPQVVVGGHCTMVMTPDQASTSVNVSATGSDVTAVLDEATKRFNAFLEAVKALNLPDAELSGSGISVTTEYDYDHGKRSFRDYHAQGSLHIVTSDIAKLAQIAPLAAKNEIEDVGAIDLSVSDATQNKAVLECLPKAAADAKERAQALASGLGLTIGAPLLLSDQRVTAAPHTPVPMLRKAAIAETVAQVPPGEIRKVVGITAAFALEGTGAGEKGSEGKGGEGKGGGAQDD